jgi:uncharacterized membrane protein
MRSHRPRWSIRLWVLGLFTLAMASVPALAQAQASINVSATPVANNGGWVYWMAQGAIILGVIILILTGAAYLRFAPRFQRDAKAEEEKLPRHAPPVTEVRLQYTPPPAPVQAPVPAGVGATTAEAAPAAAATAPAPAAAPAAAPAGEAAPPAAAAAPRPPTPKQEGPLELDQETFDRVLQEQLDKGTDRRVAEGRARSAAAKAARAKAGG